VTVRRRQLTPQAVTCKSLPANCNKFAIDSPLIFGNEPSILNIIEGVRKRLQKMLGACEPFTMLAGVTEQSIRPSLSLGRIPNAPNPTGAQNKR
jgi:hypothetical protein